MIQQHILDTHFNIPISFLPSTHIYHHLIIYYNYIFIFSLLLLIARMMAEFFLSSLPPHRIFIYISTYIWNIVDVHVILLTLTLKHVITWVLIELKIVNLKYD